jgi:eukaryotic-like serine/threonine-protein kinase
MNQEMESLSAALADRYVLERELGEGGMAKVYLAHDVRHDRKVAVKVLRPELSAILGAERFLKEIRLTANLQHPHILPLHDSGTADGTVFYVMPYVQGESLRHRLTRDKQLPVEDAVRITREVASALDYAHRNDIVHRDIKPENILLHDGQALVADFGIALAASTAGGGTRMTETGMSLGTPRYMSPEQAMGEREITARSDIYALGCVLYEMLAGEPPFTGPTAQAIIARVVTEEPRSLRLQRRTIPAHIEAATETALAKLPADRFATAAQFSEALGRTDYTSAGSPAVTEKPVRATSRRSLVVGLPWLLLVLAGPAAAWGWLRPAEEVVTRQKIVLWSYPAAAGAVGLSLAIAPDGSSIVYADTVGGQRQLWAKARDRVEATPITGTIGAASPEFSPDGSWIAFVADGKLKKVPRLGGAPVTIADSANRDIPAVAWLDDGTILFNNPAYDLLAVSEDGGSRRHVIRVDSLNRGIISVTGLRGGRGALVSACTFGCPDMDLRLLDLRTGELRILVDDVLKAWHTDDGNVVFVRRDGGVFNVPFDLKKLAFRSPPVPVFDGVRTGATSADMVLSRSGTLIYVSGIATASGAMVEPVWVSRSGEATAIDSAWTFGLPGNFGLDLSPDGSRLAVSVTAAGHQGIWVKELDKGPFVRLTFDGSNTRPRWTPDGNSVMYVSSKAGGNFDLRMRRADGTGQEETIADLPRPIFDVVSTADSTRLILRMGQPPTRDIVLFTRGDTGATALIASSTYEEVAPALSPDGRWLAYSSNESGAYEIYVRPYPDVNSGRWQISRAGGSEPLWSRSGRELFFRDANGMLVSVAVTLSPSFAAREQKPLFAAGRFRSSSASTQYGITPDDSRFVFTRLVGNDNPENSRMLLVQVENWLGELRQTTRR